MAYPITTSTALRSTSSPANGSRTMTITADPTKEGGEDSGQEQDPDKRPHGVLKLRGARNTGPRVAWDDDVVDNEHMGKKKSKICCIYHKPRPFDESSSDESSSDSDSDSSCGGNDAHSSDQGDHHSHHRHHRHRHHHHRPKPQDDRGIGSCEGEPGPNAYERQPSKKEKEKRQEGVFSVVRMHSISTDIVQYNIEW
ncbi:hypothetical protein P691DRAFT_667502 [Macrolepiota fuliginosa MF-IS2]|uniref:Type 1 phosphatases regulator n=1 Tax=Macrolepiota fuliginosa MF-IS2 TaxID=1400762 RepID=A0A9P6C2W9_9AGAR|nr:hypothetical protein P691DRAFT_667502 [Macrolepiota fuliginosa MF-IS2]